MAETDLNGDVQAMGATGTLGSKPLEPEKSEHLTEADFDRLFNKLVSSASPLVHRAALRATLLSLLTRWSRYPDR